LGLSVSDYRDKQLEDLLEDQRWRAMSRSERLKCVRVEKMSKGDLQKRFEEFNGSCAYCGDPLSRGRYLDHVVPIFRKGNDTLDNVVYTCHPCNQSKGASNPLDWYRDKPFWTQEKEDKIIAVTGKLCTTMELIFGGG
jgi:5-methylcytosine-specific restriction endonuclease McrA